MVADQQRLIYRSMFKMDSNTVEKGHDNSSSTTGRYVLGM